MGKTQITAEPGTPFLAITREFDAPKVLIFRAHTEPDLLAQWLGPCGLEMTVERYEVRDGRTTIYANSVAQSVADRDAMVESGMESALSKVMSDWTN